MASDDEVRCPSRSDQGERCTLAKGHGGAHRGETADRETDRREDEHPRVRAARDARVLAALNAAVERSSARRVSHSADEMRRHDRLLAAIDRLTDRLVAFVEEDE